MHVRVHLLALASLSLSLPLMFGAPAAAQDNASGGEPIVPGIDPAALAYDILVDGTLAQDDPANRRFRTLQAGYAAATDGTAERPTVIGIAPNVYLLPETANGISLSITKNNITLLGLTNNRRSVVLADNRGNRQGNGEGLNNGYVIDVNAAGFTARNLTILNYCNVDYEYPGDPTKNLTKRSGVITQAVALQAQGDRHVYENVALLSRLDTMFLRTTRSYFRNVYIEGTDDFIGGGTVSAWENSEVVFPTGSGVMAAGNVAFINTRFSATNGLQFSKTPGSGVALINVQMPANSPTARVSWVRDNAPPRPTQNYLTYRVTDANGQPAIITDGSTGPATFEYSRELSDEEARAFNPWNLLRATPTGAADDWDPAGVRDTYENAGAGSLIFRMTLTGTPASVRTAGPGATIGASVAPARAPDRTITWSTPSSLITLSRTTGPDVVVTGNNPGAPEYVPVIATAANGFHAQAWVFVEPAYVDPPVLSSGPALRAPAEGALAVDYAYDLASYTDQSLISWSSCDDASCANARTVAVSRGNQPLTSYTLTPGDIGKLIRVGIEPKHNQSDPGPAVFAVTGQPIGAQDLLSSTVSPNFRNFVATENPAFEDGRWTVLGTWAVEPGDALVNGYGIRAGSQGAQLLYQVDGARGDMRIELTMTPEKTAGSGFGSPGSPADGNTVQKSDIYIKYDPRTQTGYSLRYWRTTLSTSACMFQLYRITQGVGSPLNDTQILSGVFKPNTELVMSVTGTRLSVSARNNVDSETLALEGEITPNDFGGTGVAWYGTVPRGNSNTYSRFQISYPSDPLPPSAGAPMAPGGPDVRTLPGDPESAANGPAAPGAAAPGSSASGAATPGSGIPGSGIPGMSSAEGAAPGSASGCATSGPLTAGVGFGSLAVLALGYAARRSIRRRSRSSRTPSSS